MLLASDIWSAESAVEIRTNLLMLPSSRAACEKLTNVANVACDNVSLRSNMQELSTRFGFAYWIDRRVDADAPLRLMLSGVPLGESIDRLAKLAGAESGLVENVVVIAPRGELACMQFGAVRLHDQLSSGAAAKPARLQPLEWPELTTPNELAQQIAKNNGLQKLGALPHDLMNAGKLQACTLATQLSLLYGGFDRSVTFDSGAFKFGTVDKSKIWRADYPASSLSPDGVAEARQDFPTATIEVDARTVRITGLTNAHVRALSQPSRGRSPTGTSGTSGTGRPSGTNASGNRGGTRRNTKGLDAQRLTFELQNQTLGAALEYLAQNLSFELQWDDAIQTADKEKRVSLSAKELPLNEVLEKLGLASGLSIRRAGTVVKVSRSK